MSNLDAFRENFFTKTVGAIFSGMVVVGRDRVLRGDGDSLCARFVERSCVVAADWVDDFAGFSDDAGFLQAVVGDVNHIFRIVCKLQRIAGYHFEIVVVGDAVQIDDVKMFEKLFVFVLFDENSICR